MALPMPDTTLPLPPARLAPDQAYSLRRLVLVWAPLMGALVFGLGRIALGRDALRPEGHLITLGSLWLYLTLLAWLVASARRSGLSLATTLGPRPRIRWLPEVGVVAWLHLQLNAALFLMLLAALYHLFPGAARGLGETASRTLGFGHTPVWLQWVIIVGLAPLTEEWLFRGVLHHRFARRWGAGRAQLATSGIFAILHMNPFGVFALGMMLQALYRRTRSLTPCVLAHALNNAVPLALLQWNRSTAPSPGMSFGDLTRIANAWPAWVLMSVLLVALLIWHLRSRWPARAELTPWAEAAGTGTAAS